MSDAVRKSAIVNHTDAGDETKSHRVWFNPADGGVAEVAVEHDLTAPPMVIVTSAPWREAYGACPTFRLTMAEATLLARNLRATVKALRAYEKAHRPRKNSRSGT